MRILFICDYFPPFTKGGGEISSYWQIKRLALQQITPVVLTPCYLDKKKIEAEKWTIYRYFWPFRMDQSTPVFFQNPLYCLYLFLLIIRLVKREKITIIHCQGKWGIPAAILAKKLFKLPLVATIRDYGGVCQHGFCLWHSKQSCNWINFFSRDFLFYWQNYIRNNNLFTYFIQLLASYWGKLNTTILAYFLRQADKLVSVSHYLASVYSHNGYERHKIITIYNVPPSPVFDKTSLPSEVQQRLNKFPIRLLYAGKLSLGKGTQMLISTAQNIVKANKNVLFVFAGKIYYPIKKVQNPNIIFLNYLEPKILLALIKEINIVCIPSLWPEPLSRVVLEAFGQAKPVLSTTVGGQPEIVSASNGWLCESNELSLLNTISKAIKEQKHWLSKGKLGREKIAVLLEQETRKLISLYKSFI
jgi:glycosyltransferase involved in cell wall biosynthesis